MENFLSDQNKYQKTAAKDDDFLNFINSQQLNASMKFKKGLLTLLKSPKKHEDI